MSVKSSVHAVFVFRNPFVKIQYRFLSEFTLFIVMATDHRYIISLNFFFVALRPNAAHGLLSLDVSRSHKTTHHSRQDSFWTGDQPLHRDLYLTTHNTHDRKTSMPPAGFEPAILAGDRQQTYALDCTATGIGIGLLFCLLLTRPCLKHPQFLLLCCFRQLKSIIQFVLIKYYSVF